MYKISATTGSMTTWIECEHIVDVIDEIERTYALGPFEAVPMLHDLLSGLEHVTRIGDTWLTIAPKSH